MGAALLDMQDSRVQSLCLENRPLERLLLSRVATASPMCERLLSASLGPPIRSLVSSRPRSSACLFRSSLAGMKLARIISSNAAVPCRPYCNDKNTQCSFSATYAAGCCDCTGQKRGVKRSVEESARACGRVWLHCAASLSLEACCQKSHSEVPRRKKWCDLDRSRKASCLDRRKEP